VRLSAGGVGFGVGVGRGVGLDLPATGLPSAAPLVGEEQPASSGRTRRASASGRFKRR